VKPCLKKKKNTRSWVQSPEPPPKKKKKKERKENEKSGLGVYLKW
jgi:hypothetical protein